MSEKVRIQDDLYNYVNQEKLDQLVIPEDMPFAGGFADLDKDVEKLMINELNQLAKSKEAIDPNMAKAVTLYSMIKDVKKRNKNGIKPIKKHLAFIQSITDIATFNRKLKVFFLNRYPLPFRFDIDVDFKDTNKYCIGLAGPGTILPDTTMYNDANPQKQMMLDLWKNFAAQALNFTDLSEEDKALYLNDTLEFDAIIATLVKSREEWSDYIKAYNPMRTGRVNGLLKPIKYKSLIKKLFGFVPEMTIANEPRFLKGFKTLFNEETFPKYIHWVYVNYLLDKANALSEDLRIIAGGFRRAISGIAKPEDPEKYAYRCVSRLFSEPIGNYYAIKYFGEEAKKDVTEMVQEIVDAYKERIAQNDILSDATKEKAILKLSTMKLKMGYPDKVDPIFDKLEVNSRDSLVKILDGMFQVRFFDKVAKFNDPVDKTKWHMQGHTVNACYDPTSNDITFPAGILQAPFYSIKQSRSENLGGIGAVIGHEISHAFDNNGSKMDENGNIANWWTKEDFKRFDKKVKAMIKQFDGIELPWGKVNSKLIVSENIADNGGMAVTLHIMKKMKNPNYEEYFKNWARVWCLKATEKYLSIVLTVDVHGPSILRANMPPRNFPEWYETFKVKSSDKMYIPASKRLVIW